MFACRLVRCLLCLPALLKLPELLGIVLFFWLYFLFRLWFLSFLWFPGSFLPCRCFTCFLLKPHNAAVFQVDKKVDDKGTEAFPVYADDGKQGCRKHGKAGDNDLCCQRCRDMEYRETNEQREDQRLRRVPEFDGPAEHRSGINEIRRDDVYVVFFVSHGHSAMHLLYSWLWRAETGFCPPSVTLYTACRTGQCCVYCKWGGRPPFSWKRRRPPHSRCLHRSPHG